MKKSFLSLGLVAAAAVTPFFVQDVHAGETAIYDSPKDGRVLQAAHVREGTSTATKILRTLPAGTSVSVSGIEHGWYHIVANGESGYMADWLIELSDNTTPAAVTKTTAVSASQSGTYIYRSRVRTKPTTNAKTAAIVSAGTSVQILDHKDGWYQIRRADGKTGWSADWLLSVKEEKTVKEEEVAPAAASKPAAESKATKEPVKGSGEIGQFMYRSHVRSSQSTSADIVTTVLAGTRGTILDHQNGWYKVKLSNGTVGWSADWLIQLIDEAEEEAKTSNATIVTDKHEPIQERADTQAGMVPDGVDLVTLNTYWLQKINTLRSAKGLRELILDQRFVNTAAEYAAYMGQTGATNHERPRGMTMHQWINTKGVVFTDRHSDGGWETNYFTENISWGYADGTTESVQKALDQALEFFLSEKASNGPHYRTIYHPDWNSVGLGFYFEPVESGKYKVYVAYHYGSLAM